MFAGVYMSAIKITVVDGNVELQYEEKTAKNIKARLNQLKNELGITWCGVALVFGLKPTDSSVKLFKRWSRDPSLSSSQEMPDNLWKLLLMLVEGQEKIAQ